MGEISPVQPVSVARDIRSLPAFIEPMLARPGQAFDSDQHLFEIKWDGTRALAYIDGERRLRIMNRRRVDLTYRYPDLQFLCDIEPGTILDGEIVVIRDDRPDFAALQSRQHTREPARIARLARATPALYVVFDRLYRDFEPILRWPCEKRRESARQLVQACGDPHLAMSEGIVGAGVDFFRQVEERGLEGMVAKRLDSPYLPGKRTDAWLKIKKQQTFACAIIGFVPDETGKDFRALILAADVEGSLQYVGRVGTGFDGPLRERINRALQRRLCERPVVLCRIKGTWVEPGLYCTVRCMERTASGQLRAPVFGELYDH